MSRVPPAVVLFDLDDTLFAHRAAVARGIEAHVASLGAPYDRMSTADTVTLWHDLEEHHYHSYLAGTLDYEGQRRARARDFAARHGIALDDAAASTWFTGYSERYVESWALHDDAIACLDELEARIPGVRFGLITNGDLTFQLRKIKGIGLDTRVESVIASGAVGVAKPDPAIFLHACHEFGVQPHDAAYIGDRLRTDAIGAARAGLTGVWLDRTGAEPAVADDAEASEAGVIRIRSLTELAPLLAP